MLHREASKMRLRLLRAQPDRVDSMSGDWKHLYGEQTPSGMLMSTDAHDLIPSAPKRSIQKDQRQTFLLKTVIPRRSNFPLQRQIGRNVG